MDQEREGHVITTKEFDDGISKDMWFVSGIMLSTDDDKTEPSNVVW